MMGTPYESWKKKARAKSGIGYECCAWMPDWIPRLAVSKWLPGNSKLQAAQCKLQCVEIWEPDPGTRIASMAERGQLMDRVHEPVGGGLSD